jgi:hypothetical protein
MLHLERLIAPCLSFLTPSSCLIIFLTNSFFSPGLDVISYCSRETYPFIQVKCVYNAFFQDPVGLSFPLTWN